MKTRVSTLHAISPVLVGGVSILMGVVSLFLFSSTQVLPIETLPFFFKPISIGLLPFWCYNTSPAGYSYAEYYQRDCISIRGQNALVTGANRGMGFEIAMALAKCGVDVTLACRDGRKCEEASEEIRKEIYIYSEAMNDSSDDSSSSSSSLLSSSPPTISSMVMDTSSLASVKAFSEKYLIENKGRALDMLFLNAGRGALQDKQQQQQQQQQNQAENLIGADHDASTEQNLVLSPDGIELIFATNYVGHHLLWKYLEPLVKLSTSNSHLNIEDGAPERHVGGRVILTSSVASYLTFPHIVPTNLDELQGQKQQLVSQKDWKYYGQSKLAQIVWAKKVARMMVASEGNDDGNGNGNVHGNGARIFVNAAQPGMVDTGIWNDMLPSWIQTISNYMRDRFFWSTKEGILTLLYLGTATGELTEKNISGKFFHPQAREVINSKSMDEKLQDEFWKFSEELVANFV
jgi:NAD(P)-dependent dehydrogenase (short-subunit alcohol dehydrogenase family)